MSSAIFNNINNVEIYGGVFTLDVHMVSTRVVIVERLIFTDLMNRKRSLNVCVPPTRLTTELFLES